MDAQKITNSFNGSAVALGTHVERAWPSASISGAATNSSTLAAMMLNPEENLSSHGSTRPILLKHRALLAVKGSPRGGSHSKVPSEIQERSDRMNPLNEIKQINSGNAILAIPLRVKSAAVVRTSGKERFPVRSQLTQETILSSTLVHATPAATSSINVISRRQR